MKILIVDDNADDRRLMKYIVERKGHEAMEAGDGLEGLKMARLQKPDLIISDALMPVMDGFQFLRHMKEDETLQSIPFIFYSATYRADKDVDLAIALGAESYIIKPRDPDELWEEVEIILQNREEGEIITPELIREDEEYLKRYREVVATKLEEKIRELEDTKTKLEESEAFVRNILESVDEGFIVIDRDYRILSANKAFYRSCKMPLENVIGTYCYACSHHADKPCFEAGEMCAVRETFETGLPARAVHIHYDKEGKPSYYEVKSYPMRDISGAVASAIEVTIDITEKTKLEEQLQHAQKMEAIGILAGGIAHDFNNVLSAVLGYGSMLEMKMQKDDPLRSYVKHILAASERAAALTQSLLAFSRKQIINLKPVALNEIVRNITKLISVLVREDIELRTVFSLTDNMTVMADAGQIEQVLMNLATNARDAMQDGGVLTIETSSVCLDDEFAEKNDFDRPGMYAMISVSDTGIGIAASTRDKIFEPFFTTKEIGKGTGLGLSIVYGIIRQHGGNVRVYSEPGQGTTFKIYLPIVEASAEEAKKEEIALLDRGTETVLVAEDDEALRRLSKSVLETFGYKVITAADGEDAISKYRDNSDDIQLLIFDLIMPRKSGKEAYEEILRMKPGVKVLFMSGYPTDVISQKGIFEKGVGFLYKPVLPTDLLKKVRETLDEGNELSSKE